ncbi:hypothetical protein ABPG72_020048 [Tetrahymena utriculariae]
MNLKQKINCQEYFFQICPTKGNVLGQIWPLDKWLSPLIQKILLVINQGSKNFLDLLIGYKNWSRATGFAHGLQKKKPKINQLSPKKFLNYKEKCNKKLNLLPSSKLFKDINTKSLGGSFSGLLFKKSEEQKKKEKKAKLERRIANKERRTKMLKMELEKAENSKQQLLEDIGGNDQN